MNKICTCCKIEKGFDFFYKKSSSSDECRAKCKSCEAMEKKDYYLLNKKSIQEQNKKWRLKNKDKEREQKRRYVADNKEKVREKQLEWIKNNKEKYKEYQRVYANKRRADDPNTQLAHRMRNRILAAVKREFKSLSSQELLGCSMSEFNKYFQSLFTNGMTWEKFLSGEIHIDHIIPCSAFDLTKEEEQRKCFHYTNLQPLWAIDNLRKSDKCG